MANRNKRGRWSAVGRVAAGFLFALAAAGVLRAEDPLQRRIDSLFVIASSGEVRYRDLTEPAMDSIAAIGEEAVPYLIDKFTTKSARDRWTIIWTLQRIGKPATPYLIEALNRPDDLVVSRVAWAMGDIGDSAAVPALIGAADHKSWQVREEVIGALGQIGDNRGDDAVIAALNDSIGQVRKAAVVSVGQLRIDEAAPRLVNRLGDAFFGARLAASDALLKLDTVLILAALIDSLRSANSLTAGLCARTLGNLAGAQAIEALRIQATQGADPGRRVQAALALAAADPTDRHGLRASVLAAQQNRLDSLKVESAFSTARHDQKGSAQ